MQLNCKPGDSAQIIPHDDKMGNFVSSQLIGKIVKVLGYVPLTDGDCPPYYACWMLEKPITVKTENDELVIEGLTDAILRPIRDEPGIDESLLWVPVPNTNKEKGVTMNKDELPKAAAKYEPKHGITITLNVHVTKDPAKIAQMIEQRAFTIDGVEYVSCARSEIYELVKF